jgi:hypothetical protein
MQSTKARRTLLIALPLTLALGFAGGAAYAADARLDQADAHVDQAIALLTSADNPNRGEPKFGGHRFKAIQLLRAVKKEIEKAKHFADRPGPGPKPSSTPPAPTTPPPAPTAPPKDKPGDGPGKGPRPDPTNPKGPRDPGPGDGPKGPKGPKGPGTDPGNGPSPTPTTGPKTKG